MISVTDFGKRFSVGAKDSHHSHSGKDLFDCLCLVVLLAYSKCIGSPPFSAGQNPHVCCGTCACPVAQLPLVSLLKVPCLSVAIRPSFAEKKLAVFG
jgi:hypothetical protein